MCDDSFRKIGSSVASHQPLVTYKTIVLQTLEIPKIALNRNISVENGRNSGK